MSAADQPRIDDILARLEQLLDELSGYDEQVQARIVEVLDGVDALHRLALARLGRRLGDELGAEGIERLRDDPAVAWLFDAYALGVDQRAAAEAALAHVRPYVESHGGQLQLLGVDAGVVRVRLAGACSGCTASSVTLRDGVRRALEEHLDGFIDLEVEMDEAPLHPPPGATQLPVTPAGP
jgi:Fe-S cluster biogenesis protein NfuA